MRRPALSFRTRLFLLVGGLLLTLAGAQLALTRSLARDLSSEIDLVAFQVSEAVAHEISAQWLPDPAPASGGAAALPTAAHRFVFVGPGDGGERPTALGDESRTVRREVRELPDGGRVEVQTEETRGPGGEIGVRKVVLSLAKGEEASQISIGGARAARAVTIPRGGLERRLEGFTQRLLTGSLAVLGVGLLLAGALAHRLSRPLARLAGAAREVGEGQLGLQVPVERSDEVGQALAAFNRMSGRLAELEERARQATAERQLAELAEVARGLAHSLRNPLNALGLSLEEVAGRGGADGTTVEVARRQIRRIDSALRSFLTLASAGAAASTALDLEALAHDVALEALQDAGGRVGIEVEPAAAELPARRGVEAEVRAILQALVVNAVEASPPGGRVRVRLAAVEGGRSRVEVDDDGPGLSPDVRARLFTPHLSTKPHGSGMGLFLAQRLAVTRYGGRLDLADRPAGGTRAAVELGDRADRQVEGTA